MKDKNGIEIYGKDEVSYCDEKATVKWNNEDACFEMVGVDWKTNCWIESDTEIIEFKEVVE